MKAITDIRLSMAMGHGAGTLIQTVLGERPIETLKPGDLVVTDFNGLQPVAEVRRIVCDAGPRENWPVRITADALGIGMPSQDLLVSGTTRLVYRNARIPLMFEDEAVFVRAKSLVASFPGVFVERPTTKTLTYYALVLNRNEVIRANGYETESHVDGARPSERGTADPYMTLRSWELMAAVA